MILSRVLDEFNLIKLLSFEQILLHWLQLTVYLNPLWLSKLSEEPFYLDVFCYLILIDAEFFLYLAILQHQNFPSSQT